MSEQNPSPAVTGVVASPAKDAWTLRLLKAAWPTEAAVLILVTVAIILGLPDRMGAWMPALSVLAGIVAAQGAVAFGGPAIKRAQEAARGGNGG